MTPPPLAIRIRPMLAADIERVAAIAASLSTAPHWTLSAYHSALNPEAAPRRIALVAEASPSSIVTGFAIASLLPPQAELETIAVPAAAQRQGIARQLFAALLDQLRAAAATELLLELRAANPALALYRSLGFEQTGRRPNYYADPVEDALLMRLRLR